MSSARSDRLIRIALRDAPLRLIACVRDVIADTTLPAVERLADIAEHIALFDSDSALRSIVQREMVVRGKDRRAAVNLSIEKGPALP